jgi:hypothetical protein
MAANRLYGARKTGYSVFNEQKPVNEAAPDEALRAAVAHTDFRKRQQQSR